MKMNAMKKLLALALAMTMTATVLTSCGNSAQESDVKSSEVQSSEVKSSEMQSAQTESSVTQSSEVADAFEHDPVLNELGVEPFVNEEVTITIGLVQNANIENYDTNYFTLMLEEINGVNIEFMLFPAGKSQEKLQLMVAGGEKLPDIFIWSISDALAQIWGAEGYLVPLEDYFENSSLYAVENFAALEEMEGVDTLSLMTCSDGHIWSFPCYAEGVMNAPTKRAWVYEPWLEKLNLELPTTTEEFENMLYAFKSQDPNGNGKADEIPMLGNQISLGGFGGTFWEYLMNAFVPSNSQDDWLLSEGGQLSVSYTREGWKDGVKYINNLVGEGLIDPVSFSQDPETFKQVMNSSGDQLVGCFVYSTASFINASHPSKNHWVLLEPLTGPEGVCSAAYNVVLPSNKAYITRDCEHPEVAFRILDLMGREDITITSRYGEQGVHWDFIEDVKKNPEYADKKFDMTFMGYEPYIYVYENLWNQPNNTHWMNVITYWRKPHLDLGYRAANMDPERDRDNYELSLKLQSYIDAKPAEPITKIKYATAELEAEATLIASDLYGYVLEKLASWCTGTSDVETEWNEYLTTLEQIGLSDWLEIQQAGWN